MLLMEWGVGLRGAVEVEGDFDQTPVIGMNNKIIISSAARLFV